LITGVSTAKLSTSISMNGGLSRFIPVSVADFTSVITMVGMPSRCACASSIGTPMLGTPLGRMATSTRLRSSASRFTSSMLSIDASGVQVNARFGLYTVMSRSTSASNTPLTIARVRPRAYPDWSCIWSIGAAR
jgi:hypothetical protein